LQLQLWPEAERKGKLENSFHKAICTRMMTLDQGQATFRPD